jgi:hypothetical protein
VSVPKSQRYCIDCSGPIASAWAKRCPTCADIRVTKTRLKWKRDKRLQEKALQESNQEDATGPNDICERA